MRKIPITARRALTGILLLPLLPVLPLLSAGCGAQPPKKPDYQGVDAPAADTLPAYELTAERLGEDSFNAAFAADAVRHDNGVLQIGRGNAKTYASFLRGEEAAQRLVTMDIVFQCDSHLVTGNKLQSYGQILFCGAKESDLVPSNPCYFLEYEDNGDFSLRIGKNGADGVSYLGAKTSVEPIYLPYAFNRLQIGFFPEDGGIRVLVYFNGYAVINVLDEAPDEALGSHIFFQNASNVLYLRGTDTEAELPVAHPVAANVADGIQTYDFSAMEDYNFRTLITVMSAQSYTDDNGVTLPYRILLPAGYSPKKKYPLALYLHGSGVIGKDNLYQLAGDVNIHHAFLDREKTEPFIYIVPQCPGPAWNENDYDVGHPTSTFTVTTKGTEESKLGAALHGLLLDVIDRYAVDEGRVYLSGASMGGMGAYGLLGRYPDLFAGALIGCGNGDLSLAEVYATVPLCLCHGALDPRIDVKYARDMAAAVEAAGGKVLYKEYADKYHDFTDRAEMRACVDWMFGFARS